MTKLHQYFGLQLLMAKRHLMNFGLNPIIGFIIILTGFYAFSFYLFSKSEYAHYFYALIALSIVLKYNETNRNDFLKFTFSKDNYLKIRILENLIIVTPFIIFLCFKKELYTILLLIALSIFVTSINTNKQVTFTIPTPFYKKPFEFIIGFRNWLSLFLLAYFLTAMSVTHQNFSLGVFSLMLVFLVCFSFYNDPENEFYVWVHKSKVNGFLFDKIKTAIIFSTVICLPITLALLFFFHSKIQLIICFQVLGYCYLLTVILAKYSTYPQRMNLPQGILLAWSIIMPPILLALIPFFYLQSYKRLKEFLA